MTSPATLHAPRSAGQSVEANPQRLAALINDRQRALRIAGALENLVAVPPEALSLFEERPSGPASAVWRLEAYFTAPRDANALGAELQSVLGETVPPFADDPVPPLNWVALSQAALPPVHAGRFTIHGSHDRARVPQGPNAILIDAGEAFGTAHHATTLGCLVAIDRLTRRQRFRRVLDLGCGSGILAIAAARALPAARIIGVDIDRQSVAVARANARANRLRGRIELRHGMGVAHASVRRNAPYDLLVANILAGPLVALAPAIRTITQAGGTAVLSGILNREAPVVIAAMRAQGFALAVHDRRDGWSTLTLRRRPVAAKRAP